MIFFLLDFSIIWFFRAIKMWINPKPWLNTSTWLSERLSDAQTRSAAHEIFRYTRALVLAGTPHSMEHISQPVKQSIESRRLLRTRVSMTKYQITNTIMRGTHTSLGKVLINLRLNGHIDANVFDASALRCGSLSFASPRNPFTATNSIKSSRTYFMRRFGNTMFDYTSTVNVVVNSERTSFWLSSVRLLSHRRFQIRFFPFRFTCKACKPIIINIVFDQNYVRCAHRCSFSNKCRWIINVDYQIVSHSFFFISPDSLPNFRGQNIWNSKYQVDSSG